MISDVIHATPGGRAGAIPWNGVDVWREPKGIPEERGMHAQADTKHPSI
jgi:hypothetical protein